MSQNNDWYRSSTWKDADRKLFDQKIARSRSNFHRQQYARLKAMSLISTNRVPELEAAAELLNKSLSEWCETPLEKDETYATLGEACRRLGDHEKAITAYEASITWRMNLIHRGYWDYPEMIVSEGITDKFDRALEIVSRLFKDEARQVLETNKFIYHAVRAVVLNYREQSDEAKEEAQAALSTAKIERSIFRFHPEVGLVDARKYRQLIKTLKTVAR